MSPSQHFFFFFSFPTHGSAPRTMEAVPIVPLEASILHYQAFRSTSILMVIDYYTYKRVSIDVNVDLDVLDFPNVLK